LSSDRSHPGQTSPTLRWGIVGTGFIADRMAPMIRRAHNAQLQAVASRRLETARSFADEHGIKQAFAGLEDLLRGDTVDAVYLAIPTAAKEAAAVSAAQAGKHVLIEKPFADLDSMHRIADACRVHGVALMDATHFSHHPRTVRVKALLAATVGSPRSITSAFLISMDDRDDIRFDPSLEPYGAIGDVGWYCARAAAEYLDDGVELIAASGLAIRDPATGAALRGIGALAFDDGSLSGWEAGFEYGAGIMDLRIAGPKGAIKLDDFALQRPAAGPARFEVRGGWEDSRIESVAAPCPEAALMFENFAALAHDEAAREASIRISERTQRWLDAAWRSVNEGAAA